MADGQPGPRGDDSPWGMGSSTISDRNLHLRDSESEGGDARRDWWNDQHHEEDFDDGSDHERGSAHNVFHVNPAIYDHDEHRYGYVRFAHTVGGGISVHVTAFTDRTHLQRDFGEAMGRATYEMALVVEQGLDFSDVGSTFDDGHSSNGFTGLEESSEEEDQASTTRYVNNEWDNNDNDWEPERTLADAGEWADDAGERANDAASDRSVTVTRDGSVEYYAPLQPTDTVWIINGAEYDRHGVLIERTEYGRAPNRPTTIATTTARPYTGPPALEYLFQPDRA